MHGMASAVEARIHDGDVGLIEFDLDDLKGFNDVHGHASGDEAIREAAVTARHALGAEFELFRFGGDEFAAVAAAPIAPDDLFAAAERTRRAIEAGTPVTASFGIGFARPGEADSGGFEVVWTAWQLAKLLGKNTVVDTEVVRHPLTDLPGLRTRWASGDVAAAAAIVAATPTRDQPAWAAAVLAAVREGTGQTSVDDLLDDVAQIAADPGRWAEGHSLFQAIRTQTLHHDSHPGDPGLHVALNVAELAAKVISNASRSRSPFDADSGVRLVRTARAVAERSPSQLADRIWDALTSRCV